MFCAILVDGGEIVFFASRLPWLGFGMTDYTFTYRQRDCSPFDPALEKVTGNMWITKLSLLKNFI